MRDVLRQLIGDSLAMLIPVFTQRDARLPAVPQPAERDLVFPSFCILRCRGLHNASPTR